MAVVRLIEIKEEILADNAAAARRIRERLHADRTCLLNIMSSPGSGKTSLILRTIHALRSRFRICVVEADIDSAVDAEKVAATGIPAVQMKTGGFCHVEAAMVDRVLQEIDPADYDLIILENVGNLVCPAEFDTGAAVNAMILSVPEGDDKPLKYPLMFATSDALVLNKIDYLELAEFDLATFTDRVRRLNATMPIFELSCRTGRGVEAWADWVADRMARASPT